MGKKSINYFKGKQYMIRLNTAIHPTSKDVGFLAKHIVSEFTPTSELVGISSPSGLMTFEKGQEATHRGHTHAIASAPQREKREAFFLESHNSSIKGFSLPEGRGAFSKPCQSPSINSTPAMLMR